jgi:acyl-CoA ligase (AMP-forming) (exosortase A-associated)
MLGVPTRTPDLIAKWADEHGGLPALTYAGVSLTYAELWTEICRVAAGFSRLGVTRGERVGVYLEKRVETVTAIVGAMTAGAVSVPINHLSRPKQVAHILADCEARVLITSLGRLATLRNVLDACPSVERVVLVAPGAERPSRRPVTTWDELRSGPPGPGASPDLIDVDPAAILYTSGSTGPPKGVVVSHRNQVAGADSVTRYLRNRTSDVILAVLPFSFDAGLSQLTTGFAAGAHVVLMNYLLPREVVRLCAEHRVTGLTGVPPLWIQLAEQDWPAEASRHMRYFANTGGRMPKPTLDRLRAIFPMAEPFLMYGLTEAFRSTYLDPAEIDRRPDSIGKAIPNAEILVVRADGSPCDVGEEGELVHRGALVTLGYWNDPLGTASRYRSAPGRSVGLPAGERAVWSGDTVVRDADGFLYFVGRADEMIKTSGYRVSPTEVEEAAYETGMVREAVAFGRGDFRLGERVVLVVACPGEEAPDPERLRIEMRHRLPGYMIPREIVVRASLARSPNGKFDRKRIREES